jgi:Ca2+-binding EF-hand superfamily protein
VFIYLQYDLVDLLTKKELCAAKATFNIMDIDGDGRVKEYEVKEAFKNWYRNFEKRKLSLT